MKKLIIIICTFTLTLFFSGTVGFSDILKDLDKFEKSLGDWVSQIDEMNTRISSIEDDKVSREKQTAELNRSLANIESLLSDMDAKVDRVESMSSLEGVKEIVKSFEGTLNVFKKRFAKLSNRIEDQEVKTAVLERMYKTANKPLDTLMQAIDEQKNVINKLGEKLESQEQIILSMKESLQKQTSSDETYVKGIEELNSRLSKLESGVLVQTVTEQGKHEEKHPSAPVGRHETYGDEKHAAAPGGHHETHGEEKHVAASDEHHETHGGEKHVAASGEHHETHGGERHAAVSDGHHEKPEAHTEEAGLIDIGEGLFIKNIKFGPFGSSSQISGELVNKSDKVYGMTDFKVQVYDEEGVPLGNQGFSVYGFSKGITKPFEEIIVGVKTKEISKYSIHSSQMPTVSDTGESTIKIVERRVTIAKTETREIAPDNLEDLIFDENASPEALEGFEGVGNGFYVDNVSFNGFGSSSSATGNIKNNSENDFYSASFILKVYSKAYGLITSLDFSVRNINSGDTKVFEEIIAGVQPVDIDRYEVVFKSAY